MGKENKSFGEFDASRGPTVKYKWENKDARGLFLAEPFFGMSIDGGPVVDVERVIEIWNKRQSLRGVI